MTSQPVIQGLVEFPVDDLAPYHRNPRRGDVKAIARSLETNGQYRPIVVNLGTHTGRPNEVLAGNHTLAGAKHLGWATVWGTTVDVTDSRARRNVAADNRTADLGDYDPNELADLLTAIQEEVDGLDGTGYLDADLEAILNGIEPEPEEETDDDEDVTLAKGESLDLWGTTVGEPDLNPPHGSTWKLGEHLLVVANVHTETALYIEHLTNGERLFWPYPSLLAPFTETAKTRPVLMVQPSAYLAGWLITKWQRITGGTAEQVKQ